MTAEQYAIRKRDQIIQREGDRGGFYTSREFLENLEDETDCQNINADLFFKKGGITF